MIDAADYVLWASVYRIVHGTSIGDFNNDAKPDLVTANTTSNNVSVLLGNGDGLFQSAINFPAGVRPQVVAVGDFNGDAQPDLAVASGSSSVLLNSCASTGAHLSAVRSNTTVKISWPLTSTDFVLESTTRLNSTNWQSPFEVQTTNNGRLEVSVPLNQVEGYFRLRKR